MTAAEIMNLVKAHDNVLDMQGDRLVVDAPIGAVSNVRSRDARSRTARLA
jgi:hypothetical protein